DQPEEHFQPASQRRRAVRERLLDDSFEVGPPRRIQPGRFGHDRRDDGGEKALHARNLGVEKRSGNARSERRRTCSSCPMAPCSCPTTEQASYTASPT